MKEYIEREAVVMGVLGLTIVDPAVAQYCDAVLLQIQQAPAADVAPVVHGEWVYVDFVSPTIHCSVCKGLAPMDCCGDYHSERTNYCPHCGAKMQGGKDE